MYQCSMAWPKDSICPESMTDWMIKMSEGFTDVGLYGISESIRAYVYSILSSQASARLHIIDHTASAFTAGKVFLNNFENIVNHRVDIWEEIKHYQDNLSYALSKVDYSMREVIHMLPSDTNLDIRSRTTG